ncbi:MAG: ATP phosphoribosyltransferase [Ruminococcaceae bacterium]|nr:ATP phosphoribosyltransferase [Oscillospiraceae bacterium]
MMLDQRIFRNEEKAVFALRSLYLQYGYRQFKMSKFEEYDLYSRNKDFLVSEGVISFTDTDGKLLALKPDVTLSIIKNAKELPGQVDKFFYNENVYRVAGASRSYKEIMQTGVECLGAVTTAERLEVTHLAAKSLALIGESFKLCIAHTGLVQALLAQYDISESIRPQIFTAINEKNAELLKQVCDEEQFGALKELLVTYNIPDAGIDMLSWIARTPEALSAMTELKEVVDDLKGEYSGNLVLDFSVVSDDDYYSGIVFKGFVGGIAERVLSGGQYDKLMEKMGKKAAAIGFAVYLDTLEHCDEQPVQEEKPVINVALPKGRLGEKVYAMFEAAGFECPAIKENNRKLIFDNPDVGIRFFWVKPSDVSIYVERGAADIGVAGKDILLEYAPDVFELLDLNMGKCRMAVATKKDFVDDPAKTLRVATKFSNIAKNYYKELCRDIDIIHLNGSIELAPILGLSDVIVDIVETGKTLLENDLEPRETIVPISARLISNKASYNFKTGRIEEIKRALAEQVVKNG